MSTKSLLWSLPLLGGQPSAQPRGTVLANRHAIALTRSSASRRSRSGMFSTDFTNYLGAFLVAATALMLVAYVFGINQSAAKGYEITKERNRLNTLTEENKKLMVRTAEAGSILQIQDEAAANHLVQITNQEYLQVTQLSQR